MTTTISHRELRNNSAEILRRVVAGEVFEITNHGVVVAELRAPGPMSELDRLRALGQVREARGPRSAVRDIEPMTSDWTTEQMVDDLRGD